MHYSIGEVARRFGLAVSALRYYDQVGLLRPAGRRGTVRTYGRAELRRLALIRLLHHDGMMSLADTATTLAGHPAGDDRATRRVVEDSVGVMRRQVERLQEAQRVLEHLLTCPREDPVRDCPRLRAGLDETVDAALVSTVDQAAAVSPADGS